MYRQLADAATDVTQKAELLQAAEREVQNAAALQRNLNAAT